jgi:hypothetical protein
MTFSGRKSRIHGVHAAPATVEKPEASTRQPNSTGSRAPSDTIQGNTSAATQQSLLDSAATQVIALRRRHRSIMATVGSCRI